MARRRLTTTVRALATVQKTLGPEQNPLRLQQNQELDQLLKEGSTFTVVDQPVSLDRLQLRNIDQLNASSETWTLTAVAGK